ncbi:hypothetical protein OIU84_013088 [Salix udensis]|uniref:Uncharacterized protein n=1 Tax=Salix udensis TaxID=889485 RepID=A0AAD6NU15_9ROSI|nr:hypothetical protein OIU84_013088 [Salix udensis]
MERTLSSRNKEEEEEEEGPLSCWGRLKCGKFPWTKRRITSNTTPSPRQERSSTIGCNLTATLTRNSRKPKVQAGGRFRYSPLSYAQNFDDGSWDNDDMEDDVFPSFYSRFAPPPSTSLEEDKRQRAG